MSMRLIIRIQDQFATLSPNEKRLANYILAHEREIVGLSAAELSRAAGVSKSATTRFFQALGYENFESVRRQAREELNQTAPMVPSAVPGQGRRAHGAEAYLRREVANLTRTLEGFSSDDLRALAALLAAAPSLWIAGMGEDDVLARLALQLFGPVRPNVRLVFDPAGLAHQIASFRPKDALLLFGIAQRGRMFERVAEQAVLAEMEIVQIADFRDPTLPKARFNLRCQTGFADGQHSITGIVSLLGLIADRVAAELGLRATRRRALIASLAEP